MSVCRASTQGTAAAGVNTLSCLGNFSWLCNGSLGRSVMSVAVSIVGVHWGLATSGHPLLSVNSAIYQLRALRFEHVFLLVRSLQPPDRFFSCAYEMKARSLTIPIDL